jgi:aspartyl-tRNA(Asn)/glutamyl-tRNA(Gln) amidotransferase subunit B
MDVSRLNIVLPESPSEKRIRYNDLGLSREQIEVIIFNEDVDLFFRKSVIACDSDPTLVKLVANYLLTDLLPTTFLDEKSLNSCSVDSFVSLIRLLNEEKITSRVAKDILKTVVYQALDPEVVATERGLLQNNSVEALDALLQRILIENETIVAEVRSGKESALQYLVGQGMKATKGSANPKLLMELLKKSISSE